MVTTAHAETHDFGDLEVGLVVARNYRIEPNVYEAFLAAFDDRSPIHVDSDYAKAVGFPDRVMHGTILNGFVSHFVGMVLPGAHALLLSTDLKYHHPSFLGDELRLEAVIAQKIEANRVLVLNLRFRNSTRGTLAASGKAMVAMREDRS